MNSASNFMCQPNMNSVCIMLLWSVGISCVDIILISDTALGRKKRNVSKEELVAKSFAADFDTATDESDQGNVQLVSNHT